MATTVQNSDKKYLNFAGLSYYDSKIKAWVGQNYQPAGNYIVDNDGTLVQKINTSYTYWVDFLSGLTTPAPTLNELSQDHAWLTTNKTGLESASSWVSTNGDNILGDHSWLTTNKTGLESASSWVSTNGADVLAQITGLVGDPSLLGDAAIGRVGVLEQKIGKLTNATSWIGVVTAKPTSATVTVNGESVTCVAGDIVTVVNAELAEETGLEYIYDGSAWVELGDSSGSRSRLTEVERALSEDVVLKDDIVFATNTEIDTLFA